MPDKLDSLLRDYFRLGNIRPPSLAQQMKMQQKISEYEYAKNARWGIAAILLFFGMIGAFYLQGKANIEPGEDKTRFITGEREQVSQEALMRWRLP